MSFEGLHVVVTGGSGALGSAVVEHLIARGAICHVPNYDRLELSGFALRKHERVHVTEGVDLTDEAAVEAFYGALPELWASIQVAGGFAMTPITETRLADLHHMMRMNADTCFLACREAVRRIRSSNGGAGGRLVNVAARPALTEGPGMIPYAASKSAVASITRSLAAEVAGDGVLVNAVVPSILDTAPNREAMPDADHSAWPSLGDVAQAIAYLASPQNQVTSGALIPVYGRA